MRKFIYDVEIFPNYWLCSFLNVDNQSEILSFQISHDFHIDDRAILIEFLDSETITLIGFNNLSYDYQMLEFVYNYDGSKINRELFELSKKIIVVGFGLVSLKKYNSYLNCDSSL